MCLGLIWNIEGKKRKRKQKDYGKGLEQMRKDEHTIRQEIKKTSL